MKILVTGATGFIGQNLVKLLCENNYDVYCIVRENSDISNLCDGVKIFRYKSQIENLEKFFKQEKFDGIIHLASLFLASHKSSDISKLISSNLTFGVELLEVATKTGVKWFLNTGTFWQHFENSEYDPVNLYAASKQAFEVMAEYYLQTSDIIFTTLKLNDTFGPHDTRNKVFNLWAKIAQTQETLEMSAGEQIIDICYIEDVIDAYRLLMEHLDSKDAKSFHKKSFVVTNKQKMSLKELSKIFEQTTNTKLNIKWGGRPYRYREVMKPWDKGDIVPNWSIKYDLQTAIQKTLGENSK